MRQRDWQIVAAALKLLGCIVEEREYVVILCRAFPFIQSLRKISPVSVKIQRQLLEKLGYDLDAYVDACEACETAAE